MIMMTKSKNNQPNKKRVLALLPLSVILLLTTAFLNGLFPEETKGSPAAIANFGQSGFEKVSGTSKDQDSVKNNADKVKVTKNEKKKDRKDKALVFKVDKTVDLKDDMDMDVKVDETVDLKEDIDLDIKVDESLDLKEDIDLDIKVDEVLDLKEDIDLDVKIDEAVDPQEKVAVVKIRKSGQDDIKVIGYGGSNVDTVIYVVDGVHVKKIKEINLMI
jgi:hypothetical protein